MDKLIKIIAANISHMSEQNDKALIKYLNMLNTALSSYEIEQVKQLVNKNAS